MFSLFVRLIIGLIAVGLIIMATPNYAYAIKKPDKPQIFTDSGDTNAELDKATDSFVSLILYAGMSLSSIVIAIGIVLLLPVVGKPQLGHMAIKSGVGVFLLSAGFYVLLGFIGGIL